MAGRFINTDRTGVLTQQNISNSIIQSVKDILQNPYYLFSDKKASKCTYYNLNTTMTTLDEATRGNYGVISPDSPLRFNKVSDFFIYGLSRIEPNLEVGEYGLEAADITGEAIILPYTVVPYPGDMFILDQINKPYLFEVTGVDPNTLETGSVMYKISYRLSSTDGIEGRDIEHQVVKRLKFLIQNMGTNFSSFITEDDYNNATDIEAYSSMLKDYYISLFYNNKIQSFSYDCSNDGTVGGSEPNRYGYKPFNGFKVYDPYLVEFLIRNKVLKGSTQYIYVAHQMVMPVTFPIDYDRTFFSSIERKDISSHLGLFTGNLIRCNQRLSLLYAYPIDYYYMEYYNISNNFYLIDIFDDPEFPTNIKNNIKYNNHILKDIVIKYFNDEDITIEDLTKLRHIDYMPNKDLFYLIPIVIFCIDKYLEKILT